MNFTVQLWLLRAYAFIILIVLMGKFLEGASFTLVVAMASIGIIVQSFTLKKK